MSARSKKRLFGVLKQVIAIFLCVLMLTPFLVILLNSMKTSGEAKLMRLSLPSGSIQWDNYARVIERGNLVRSFINSVLYATLGSAGASLLAAMAAVVLSRRRTPLTRSLYFYLVMGIVLPTNMVALIRVMQQLRLMNQQYGIILLFCAINIPTTVLITYGFVGTVPRELDDAALIDGTSPMQLFFKIMLPLLKPVLTTVMLLSFTGIWNDFQMPLYLLNTTRYWPMTLAIYNFFGMYENDWHYIFADIVLTCLPVILVYLVGQKYIISGLLSGAVKG